MSTRAELLARAEELAASAKIRTPRERGWSSNGPGATAHAGERLTEEIEALRLTLLALFGPIAEAADVVLALMRTDS